MWIWERFAFGKKKAKNDPNSAYSKYRFAMFRVNKITHEKRGERVEIKSMRAQPAINEGAACNK